MKKFVVYQNKGIAHITSSKKDAKECIETHLQLASRHLDNAKRKDFKIKHQEVYRKWMIVHYDKHGGLIGYYGGHGIHIISGKLMPMWYEKSDSWSWKYYDKEDAKKDVKTLRKEVHGPVKLVKLPRKEWIEYKETN
mgnify:CR=1 FL=1